MVSQRTFHIDPQQNKHIFNNNKITTTKYSVFNFIPKTIILQFSKLANIYFLIIAILQSIPTISPLSPTTAIAPLLFVVGISIFREGYEQVQHYKKDKNENESKQVIMDLKKQQPVLKIIQSQQVVVGDILLIKKNEDFCADVVIVAQNDPESEVYINTSSLDGEKTLKTKVLLIFRILQKVSPKFTLVQKPYFNSQLMQDQQQRCPTNIQIVFQGPYSGGINKLFYHRKISQ